MVNSGNMERDTCNKDGGRWRQTEDIGDERRTLESSKANRFYLCDIIIVGVAESQREAGWRI